MTIGRLDQSPVKALMRAEADEWRRRILARQRSLGLDTETPRADASLPPRSLG